MADGSQAEMSGPAFTDEQGRVAGAGVCGPRLPGRGTMQRWRCQCAFAIS